MIAEVRISGSRFELCDPAVYSGDGKRIDPGVRQMLEIARQIETLAKLEGFEVLLVPGSDSRACGVRRK